MYKELTKRLKPEIYLPKVGGILDKTVDAVTRIHNGEERTVMMRYTLSNLCLTLDEWLVSFFPSDFRFEMWNGLSEPRDRNTPTIGLYTWRPFLPNRVSMQNTLDYDVSFEHSLEKMLAEIWSSAGLLVEVGNDKQLGGFIDLMQDIANFASLMDPYGRPPEIGRCSGPCYNVKIARQENISEVGIWFSHVKPEFSNDQYSKDHKRVSDLRLVEMVRDPPSEIRALEIVIKLMKEHYSANGGNLDARTST